MSFIYKYETSTPTPFVKPHDVLKIAQQNIFYFYVESRVDCFIITTGHDILGLEPFRGR